MSEILISCGGTEGVFVGCPAGNYSYGYLQNGTPVCRSNNWEIDMSDYCLLNSNTDLGTGNITFINEGNFSINATLSISNLELPITNQIIYIKSNAMVYI